eukprot:1600688-Pyramimonas_sp.AAC.1
MGPHVGLASQVRRKQTELRMHAVPPMPQLELPMGWGHLFGEAALGMPYGGSSSSSRSSSNRSRSRSSS